MTLTRYAITIAATKNVAEPWYLTQPAPGGFDLTQNIRRAMLFVNEDGARECIATRLDSDPMFTVIPVSIDPPE